MPSKIYLVTHDIRSTDGNLLLSAWSSEELAEKEIERLLNSKEYPEDPDNYDIEEVEIDKAEIDASIVV